MKTRPKGSAHRIPAVIAAAATAMLVFTGSATANLLNVLGCAGVTVSETQAVNGAQVVNYSGIEKRPCGFIPPAPPQPQPQPQPQPLPLPPPPPQPPPPPLRCVVPNVKGKTVMKAKAALRARRCAIGRVTQAFSGKAKKGRVIAQSKRPGTRHPRSTKVNLIVSKGARRK